MRKGFTALAVLWMTATYAWTQTTPATQAQPGAAAPGVSSPATSSDSSTAQPKEVTGKIVKLDRTRKTLTLDDGTRLAIPNSMKTKTRALKKGTMITATYEEKGGHKVATSIHVQPKS